MFGDKQEHQRKNKKGTNPSILDKCLYSFLLLVLRPKMRGGQFIVVDLCQIWQLSQYWMRHICETLQNKTLVARKVATILF